MKRLGNATAEKPASRQGRARAEEHTEYLTDADVLPNVKLSQQSVPYCQTVCVCFIFAMLPGSATLL
eukprot:6195021-Pleurochrysis_carterae.AAC.3